MQWQKNLVSLVDHFGSFTYWLLKIVLHWSTTQWQKDSLRLRSLNWLESEGPVLMILAIFRVENQLANLAKLAKWSNQNHLALTWYFQWSLSTARTSGNSKAEWSTIQEWLLYQETIDHSESDFFILWWVQKDQNMVKTLYPKPQNGSKLGEVGK